MDTGNQLTMSLEHIYSSIRDNGFSEPTLRLMDNFISNILMERQTLLNSISQSMQVSAWQVRCSSGRTSYATTREQALKQVQMLQQAKEAQQTGR